MAKVDTNTDTKTETVQVVCECEIPEGGLMASEAGELLKCLAELAELIPVKNWEERMELVQGLKDIDAQEEAEEIRQAMIPPALVVRQMSIYNPWEIISILQHAGVEHILAYITAVTALSTIVINVKNIFKTEGKDKSVTPKELPEPISTEIKKVSETLLTGTRPSYPRPVEKVTEIVLRLSSISLEIRRLYRAS